MLVSQSDLFASHFPNQWDLIRIPSIIHDMIAAFVFARNIFEIEITIQETEINFTELQL